MSSRRPTILQIVPRLDAGGAELATIEIAEAVARAGGRALVLSEGGRMAERLAAAGGELVPFPAASKNPMQLLANARTMTRIIEKESVDLVHARSRAPAWSAHAAVRRTGRPLVTTYHGAYGERSALKRLYNSAMARADVVIANSHYTAELIRTRHGGLARRIVVIHRGVDAARFDPVVVTADRMTALRAQWGAAPGQPIVLQAARLTGWKGHEVTIAATGLLARTRRLREALIVLAGDAQGRDAFRAQLLAQAEAEGVGAQVRLVGHMEDMPAAFACAHVAVIASTEPEAFGRTAVEAQAMGCPVIATDHGAPPETIRAAPGVGPGDITGWLIPPGDSRALADAIAVALALEPERRLALGTRARAHVLAAFSLAAMQQKTLAVYDQLLGSSLAANHAGEI